MEIPQALNIFLKAGGHWGQAEEAARAQGLVRKAAVGATGLDDISGANGLPFKSDLEGAFLESLQNGPGIFDTLRPSTRRAGLRSPVAISASPLTGTITSEGSPIPVSKFSLDVDGLVPQKAAALVVISKTALEAPFGVDNLVAELKSATVLATDGEFVDVLITGADTTEAASSDPLSDLKKLLDGTSLTGHGNLFFIASPATANVLAIKRAGAGGPLLFPRATPTGGEVLGVPLLVSPAAGTSLLLVDAGALVTADDSVRIALAEQAPVQMLDGFDSATEPVDSLISLFQLDAVGVLCTRAFSAQLVRTSGAAVLTGPAAAWA